MHHRFPHAFDVALPPLRRCAEFAAAVPPDDPMLRAIEAKRHRNTGPAARQRAPRQLGIGGRP
jgi:hypothetical protein